jgi:hypothetical protein
VRQIIEVSISRTGFASATLIGAGRWARTTVEEIGATPDIAAAV